TTRVAPSLDDLAIGAPPKLKWPHSAEMLVQAFRLSRKPLYSDDFTAPDSLPVTGAETMASWDFSKTGSTVTDLTNSKRHGTLVASTWGSPAQSPGMATPLPDATASVGTGTGTGTGTPPKPPEPPIKQEPEPAAAEITAALAKVKDVFKDEYDAAVAPADKAELASTLFKQAGETKDTAAKFVLFDESAQLAASGHDLNLALRILNDLEKHYEVDAWQRCRDLAKESFKGIRAKADRVRLAVRVFDMVDDAVIAEKYDAALELCKLTSAEARQGGDTDLAKTAYQRNQQLKADQKLWDDANKARTALAAGDDPAAHGTLGRYLAFVKGNWTEGFDHLGKSDDAAVKTLVANDAKAPTDPKEQLALGQQWQTYGDQHKDAVVQNGAWLRAQHWIERAQPKLTGLDQPKAAKLLKEIVDKVIPLSGANRGATTLAWLNAPEGEVKSFQGHTDDVIDIAISSTARWMATASHDGSVRVWNLATGAQVHELR
ncbi:MAG: WD40 repeat domain-containing protein, partial [Pirellulaceae bacterium]|nr:WD40 repeat domain-containing protein [Pirellulaceae bacterium]